MWGKKVWVDEWLNKWNVNFEGKVLGNIISKFPFLMYKLKWLKTKHSAEIK